MAPQLSALSEPSAPAAGRPLAGRVSLLFLPARLLFALAAQGLTAGIFALQGASDAWRAAAAWWPVYSTLTDLMCLAALAALLRREGRTVGDLFGVRGWPALRQLAWTPAYLLAVVPASVLAHVITVLFYGAAPTPLFTVVDLPPAAAWYALIVWPPIWVITEELVYLGYLLPRLEALFGRTWAAVGLTTLFWGLQHLALPWLADGQYLAWRGLSATAAVAGFTLVFAWRRKLVPLIGVHYLADLATALMLALPVLSR